MKQRRADWLTANGPCRICGTWTDLHIDHIDPSTKVSHRIWTWSEARRTVELAKCQVLCRSCHESKTAKENSDRMGGLKHGTDTMYGKMKCRCDECVEARSVKKAANRRRRKALGLVYQ